MGEPSNITPAIVETLYLEALTLAEEARCAFAEAARTLPEEAQADLSCETLRTTTRLMHALAFLLNHRAHFAGQLSAFQLQRHARLPAAAPPPEPMPTLDEPTRAVAARSIALYARLQRLERNWRGDAAREGSAVERLRARLASRLGEAAPDRPSRRA